MVLTRSITDRTLARRSAAAGWRTAQRVKSGVCPVIGTWVVAHRLHFWVNASLGVIRNADTDMEPAAGDRPCMRDRDTMRRRGGAGSWPFARPGQQHKRQSQSV